MELISRDEAIEKGLPRYFTGKPCYRNHIAERSVRSKKCIACVSEDNRNNYYKNQAKNIARSKAWQKANPDKVRAQDRARYARHREKIVRRASAWNAANPERNKTYVRNWWKNNPHKRREYHLKRRELEDRAVTSWGQERVADFYLEARRLTEETGERYEVDHIVPLYAKNEVGERVACGLHNHYNLQVIHISENRSKGARLVEDENFYFLPLLSDN